MTSQTPQPPLITPQGLTRGQVQRALRLSTLEGCTATVQGQLTGGAFQIGFALFLGCSSFWLGALGGIPAFAGLVQLFSSFLAQRYGERKALIAWFSLVSRLLWIPMLLIPFVLPRSLWVGAFLLLTLVSALCINVSAPLWTAWITDVVPEGSRGRYFGQRNMYSGWVGMVVPILGGYFLDAATKRHSGSEPMAFGVLFVAASVFAFGSFGLILRSPDVPQVKSGTDGQPHESAFSYYKAPFADRNFQRVMAFLAAMVVGQTIAGQFFTVYQLEYLHLNYTAFQLLGAVATLASLASMPLWGYLSDKYGNKPVLMISCALVLVPPLLWILAVPDGISGLWAYDSHSGFRLSEPKLIIMLLNLFSGSGWAGVGLTQFNLMIGAAPAEKRTVYVSAIAAISGLAGGIAPLAGGALMVAFGHLAFPDHGFLRSNYHLLFLISTLLRGGAMLLVGPIQEHGSRQTGYVLKQLKASKPIGSFNSIQKLSKAGSSQARVQAAEQLGRLKTPLAVEELVRALDDVALPVREQAALALGEIRDPRATLSLVGKLTDSASGISGVAATALGKIGDKAALPALAAAAQLGPPARQLAAMEALGRMSDSSVTEILSVLLRDPDLSVRTAAIRALAEREDPESLPSLIAQIDREQEPANLAILADALGRLGEPEAALPLLHALSRTQSPTVRREILNAVGSLGGGRDAFYPYLALDSYARDETVGKILINLGRRYRTRAAQKKDGDAARISVYAKQALAAYTSGDNGRCLDRLIHLADKLPPVSELPARSILLALGRQEKPPEIEEVLLGVFLVRRVTGG
ncbi:MAG: MFS transporter [Janthinobacterium lividum]